MPPPSEKLYPNVTITDVKLASAYYPILIELAQHKHCLTYSELVEKAKARYPGRPEVQSAIAVSTGRRLDVVRAFTVDHDLPDLSSLVISKGTGECGSFYTRHFDAEMERKKVFAFDWSKASRDFDGFVTKVEKEVKPRKRRKEAEALVVMATHYKEHKHTLPPTINKRRELIIESLMEGFSAEEAFDQALKSLSS